MQTTIHASATHQQEPSWLDRTAYPFTSRFVRLPSGRMHYVDEGRGMPVLLVHGTPTWSFEYRHLITALAPEMRCIAPDHLGFGLSERPLAFPYTAAAHAQNLAAFVDALGLEQMDLVVHDYGGPIGLPLALGARVRRVVVLNSWMWRFDDPAMQRKARLGGSRLGRLMYRHLDFSLRLLMPYAYGDKQKLTPAIQGQYRAVFPDADSRERVLWRLARGLIDEGDYFDGLWQERQHLAQKPTLLVWGMKDRALPPAVLERFASVLPQAEVIRIADAGHWPHEEAPLEVVTAVRTFLRRP